MAHVSVGMFKRDGKIVADREKVEVGPGDTISWLNPEPDFKVSFAADHPFEGKSVFLDREVGVVRRDAPRGKHFACTVTLGGITQSDVTGVDIRP